MAGKANARNQTVGILLFRGIKHGWSCSNEFRNVGQAAELEVGKEKEMKKDQIVDGCSDGYCDGAEVKGSKIVLEKRHDTLSLFSLSVIRGK